MKTILMNELKKGDIFCNEIKLSGIEAFIVDEVKPNKIVCTSRLTQKQVSKPMKGHVILLNNGN